MGLTSLQPEMTIGLKRNFDSLISAPYSPATGSHRFAAVMIDLTRDNGTQDAHAAPAPQPRKKTRLDTNPPKSAATRLAMPTCECKSTRPSKNLDLVACSATQCKIKIYHRACVGLTNRQKFPDTSRWRCRHCRTPLATVQPNTTVPSQTQPVVQLSGPAPAFEQEPALHSEQAMVVQYIIAGYNTFYTGSAGTGKSTVAKAFRRALTEQGKQVDVIAPSGIAALAIGGSTIFSYCGWHPNLFKEGLGTLLKKAHGKTVRQRLCRTDVLVIDEVSMLERDMLTRLDQIMRHARHNYHPGRSDPHPMSWHSGELPFGGCQVVITGDFCQLPPVRPFQYCLQCGGDELQGWTGQSGPYKCRRCRIEVQDEDKWAFRSPAWEAANFRCFELKQIHRQSDQKFISILQKCRVGERLAEAESGLLVQKKAKIETAVKLLPQKAEVNRINQLGLSQLQTPSKKYACLDFFDYRSRDEPELKKKAAPLYERQYGGPLAALRDHRFEEQVELKVNMLVILLVNLDLSAGMVNGSQGRIIGFEPYNPHLPLVPRPAVTSLLDNSRKATERRDTLSEIASLKEHQIRNFIERAPQRYWPIVRFNNGITKTIYGHCQINELGSEKPHSLIGRTQIPLLAAWAITIHKSQGMTLDRVSVDLFNSFEKEMVYVALSRARSLEGLEVVRLPKVWKSGMNKEVKGFLGARGLAC